MQRITRDVVDNKIAIVNSMLGISDDAFTRADGAFGIYQHSTVNVVRYTGTNGSHETYHTGTMRETAIYLSGLIAGIRASK